MDHRTVEQLILALQLLVNNKIISLDLPVKEVYKKIWLPDGEVSVRAVPSNLKVFSNCSVTALLHSAWIEQPLLCSVHYT